MVSVEPSITAAVRPTKESGPWAAMSSAPMARAALPLMGRTRSRRTVSAGIPRNPRMGERKREKVAVFCEFYAFLLTNMMIFHIIKCYGFKPIIL